ncbi:MAG: CopG family transcriptional regulator [Desulfuromonadales bacterium]|nr:CopG family transcriptional regulator [Desulfuromonadales bacterium]
MTLRKNIKRVKYSVRLPPDLDSALENLCQKRRGIAKNDIIVRAINEFLFPDGADTKEILLARSLERMEKRLKTIERGNEVLSEALFLFVRIWITSTHELSEEQQKVAKKAAGPRVQKFVTILGERLQSGKSLFDELPKDVFFKSEDFFEAGEKEDACDQ